METMKLYKYLILSSAFMLFCTLASAKVISSSYSKGSTEYWIIYDDTVGITQDNLVVFLHGYGASNPGCYGGWISALTTNGNAVVFPKFQTGTFLPRTNVFQKRTVKVISMAVTEIRDEHDITINKISMIGHSIGGVIAANIANDYASNGLNISGLVLCQPGFKYLKLGAHHSYENINNSTLLLNITGENDHAAGRKFAAKVYRTTSQIPTKQKLWIEHQTFKTEDGNKLSADHKDPVSPLKELDAGNRNLVIGGAFMLCETNQVDKKAYWETSIQLIKAVNNNSLRLQRLDFPQWIVSLSD